MPCLCAAAAVIPAYNECGRVTRVVEPLCRVAEVRDIVIVDDGSTDGTAGEARRLADAHPQVRCLPLPHRGKGAALFAGARSVTAPALLFLDADLVGLRPAHVAALIHPVLTGKVDMAVGVFRHGRLHTDFAHRATPWLSGQRCLRADLFLQLDGGIPAGYGIETAVTLVACRQRWRQIKVPLLGVSHPSSEFRHGIWAGLRNRARMYGEIVSAWRNDRRLYRRTRRAPSAQATRPERDAGR